MYEEDRVRALAMYNSMFDETDDETGLLQLLVSPTRQAVNLARSYDARERKLQAHAQAREAGAAVEEEPSFVQVIDRIRDQAASLGPKAPAVSDDQFSLFEDEELDTSVFDDLAAARETQNRVREFIRNHPTVYCGTHTPQGYENLEAKRVMDLEHPVETVLAEVDFTAQEA